jgi:hypothetical protein
MSFSQQPTNPSQPPVNGNGEEVIMAEVVEPDRPHILHSPTRPAARPRRKRIVISFGRVGWMTAVAAIVFCSVDAVRALPSGPAVPSLAWLAIAVLGFFLSIIGLFRGRREGILHAILGCLASLMSGAVVLFWFGVLSTMPHIQRELARAGGGPSGDGSHRIEDAVPPPAKELLQPASMQRPDAPRLPQRLQTLPWDLGGRPPRQGESIAGAWQEECGTRFRRLDFGENQSPGELAFSEDGKYLYHLAGDKRLWKLSVPEFRAERVLSLPEDVAHLQPWRGGFVCRSLAEPAIVIVDAETLNGRALRLPAEFDTLVTSPGANIAVTPYEDGYRMKAIDLENGLVIADLSAREINRSRLKNKVLGNQPNVDFKKCLISRDGAWLLTFTDGATNRFSITSQGLAHVDGGPPTFNQRRKAYPQLVGDYLVFTVFVDPHYRPRDGEIRVYHVGKKIEHAFTTEVTYRKFKMCMEPGGNRLLLDNGGGPRRVIDAAGIVQRVFYQSDRVENYPYGRVVRWPIKDRLLVISRGIYYWMELPAERDEPDLAAAREGTGHVVLPHPVKSTAPDTPPKPEAIGIRAPQIRVAVYSNMPSAIDCVWSPDGSRLYCAFKSDWVGVIDAETLIVRRVVRLPGFGGSKIALTQSTLAYGGSGSYGVVLLDPESLDAQRIIMIPRVVDLSGAPDSDHLVVLRHGRVLELVDVTTGRVLDRIDQEGFEKLRQRIAHATSDARIRGFEMTHDGRSLFLWKGAIHRFDLTEQKLRHVTAGPRLSTNLAARLQLSPDSQFLSVRPTNTAGVHLYQVDDLVEPRDVIRELRSHVATGLGAEVLVGLDGREETLVALRRGHEREFRIKKLQRREEVVFVVPHPTNPGKLVAKTTYSGLYFVDVPEVE